ncbi:hypothetical protein XZ90_001501 [Salmonella enterica subsp. enterica]|uniref:hypothetical protein n=1 Tax=Citrobacter braakii TaxID=57706 RepID=UPI001178A82A|nr:hypothetical protein [Citrobacter braakii]EBW7149098.1 hypothetical protein [Salmonella enterica subsp. enterica serovar Coeln]EDV0068813.1 hypothetical protein [Salmonella enterica subsp. enterica serovar Litchfield]EDV1958002.1 hypothetical protein [Salmonella enterica subsp. enterica serovar Litchfield]QXC16633.1 hypothetical protein I6L51_00365 [Citrobacter braakii]
MYKVSYILPEGEQVHVAVCAVKEDGSQIFQMEIQSPYEKGKSLDAYEQAAIEQYTSIVCDIAASAQPPPGPDATGFRESFSPFVTSWTAPCNSDRSES